MEKNVGDAKAKPAATAAIPEVDKNVCMYVCVD